MCALDCCSSLKCPAVCLSHLSCACLPETCCRLSSTMVAHTSQQRVLMLDACDQECCALAALTEVARLRVETVTTCLQVCVGVKPGALKSNASWYCHECAELKRNGQIK
jgi:hypothetical protein